MSKEEIWKLVEDFPRYSVSNLGGIRHNKSGRIQSPCRVKNGYLIVTFYLNARSYKRYMHQLVARAFHGPPPGAKFEVAHEDGSRTNNCADNLSWKTRAENNEDKRRHGTMPVGSAHVAAAITESDVLYILENYANGHPQWLLAKKFNITRSAVCSITQGRHWKHVDSPFRQAAKERYKKYGASK